MKLDAQIKLLPTPEQTESLRRTLKTANAACEFVSRRAWQSKLFRQYDLHRLCYHEVREQFGLSAQAAVRCIAKVADSYKLDKRRQRTFRLTGSIAFDNRILSWRVQDSMVSIWTVDGRVRIPFVCGERQRELLKTRQGESKLVLFRNQFFLAVACEVAEPVHQDVTDVLGIDLGIVNIAADSDGTVHSSSQIIDIRHRRCCLRAKLQRKGTRSARRKLRKLSGREARFAKDVNHCLSKRIVAKAKDTARAIALEDLSGIRQRITVRRSQRTTLHRWSFFQLRSFLEYKARLAGVLVILVDPRNTSRTCPSCGCADRRNRPSQSRFVCVSCGYAGHADTIAAVNIRGRAVVNWPNVARDDAKAVETLSVATELRRSAAASCPP